MVNFKTIAISIISFLLFSLFMHYSIGNYIVNKHYDSLLYNIKSTENFIKKSINVLIEEKKKLYINESKIIFSNKNILEALEKKDREAFYTYTKRYFDDIKITDENFWGLHIILADNLSFIRVHKPQVPDKLIKKGKKPLIDWVNKNKKIITSFDAGKFGYFLRVVTPIFSKNNKYLGLAEFSVNIDSLSQHIKKMFNYEIQFLVKNIQNKKFLNILPKNDENLIIFKTTNAELFKNENRTNKGGFHEILKFDNKSYKTLKIELSPSAYLETAFNITDILNKHLEFKKQLQIIIFIANTIFLFIWLISTKIYIRKHQKRKQEINKQREAIDRLNERYLLTFNAIKDAIWDWNILKDEVYFSKRWKEMLGYGDDEVENSAESFFNLIHPDDKQKVSESLEKHFENPSKNKYFLEVRLRCKDETYKWVLIRGECILDENDKPLRMLGSHTDISKRKKTEEFIKNSNKILEMIAKGEKASLVYDKIALMYEDRHPGLRCSLLELLDGKLMHGGAPSMPLEYCQAVHGLKYGPNVGSCGASTYTGKRVLVENIETSSNWKDIKQFALPHGMRSCWSEPIINSSGKVLGAFGMYYDYPALPNENESKDLVSAARLASIVMERDQSQKRIYENQKLLAEQSKLASMGEMIGNIAHQWRQPLSIISTIATSIQFNKKMGIVNEENLENEMNIINENTQYLSRTIDDFREFIKDSKDIGESSVKDILEYTCKLTDATMKNNYIKLIHSIEEDMIISANKNELVQSFINIINNAKDILKEKTKENDRYIFISTKKLDENTLEVEILDSGGGIGEEIIDKIFEPYFTTKHKSVGTGIGLSMVNKILRDKYNVKIEVYNQEFTYTTKNLRGACFRLTFKNKSEN